MTGNRKARLLVVDDSRAMRAQLTEFFRNHGLEVVTASNGAEALRCLQDQGGFDLILLDQIMPEMEGLETLERIREKHSKIELPVLMATSRSESTDVIAALELGANDYVIKPLDLLVTLARVEAQISVARQAKEKMRWTIIHSDGSLPTGATIDGRYELQEIIGRGGFALVYRARQLTTGQDVAVKLMKTHRAFSATKGEKELVRFRREMNVIGELKHPNIVRLVDSGWFAVQVDESGGSVRAQKSDHPTQMLRPSSQSQSAAARDERTTTPAPIEEMTQPEENSSLRRRLPFIVMELLRGETLFDVISRERKLPIDRAVDLILPVASALYCAHERSVVHRDLKPGNIFLVTEDHGETRPVVLDFGIAKLLGEEPEDGQELTEDSDILGTPAYSAPEQIGREDPVGPATDQYALGLILFRMITGRPAFPGRGVELLRQVLYSRVPPPSRFVRVPHGLDEVILRATAPSVAARYSSVRDLARSLLRFSSPVAQALWSAHFQKGKTVPPPGSTPPAS